MSSKDTPLVPSIRHHPQPSAPRNLWLVLFCIFWIFTWVASNSHVLSCLVSFTENYFRIYPYYSAFQQCLFLLGSVSPYEHTSVSLLSHLLAAIWDLPSWRLLWVRAPRALSYTFLNRLWFLNLTAVNSQNGKFLAIEDYLLHKALGLCLPDGRSTHPWPQVISYISENTCRHCQIAFARVILFMGGKNQKPSSTQHSISNKRQASKSS